MMTTAVWPDYAPVVADGFAIGHDADVERTTLVDGAVRQVRRFTQAPQTIQIRALIDGTAKYRNFQTWANTQAHQVFLFPDPVRGNQARVRVRGGVAGITATLKVGTGQTQLWEIACTLEVVL